MSNLSWTEFKALKALVIGSEHKGESCTKVWWSDDVLNTLQQDVQMDPRSFHGACNTLKNKGYVEVMRYDHNQRLFRVTDAGLMEYDKFVATYVTRKSAPVITMSPATRIRVLVNGIGVFCRIGDICSDEIRHVVEEMKFDNDLGQRTISLVQRVGDNNIQVDIV